MAGQAAAALGGTAGQHAESGWGPCGPLLAIGGDAGNSSRAPSKHQLWEREVLLVGVDRPRVALPTELLPIVLVAAA